MVATLSAANAIKRKSSDSPIGVMCSC